MNIEKTMFYRGSSHKRISINEVIKIISDYIKSDPTASYELTIGTDSQSFKDISKIVEVIALCRKGNGGIFFYNTDRVQKFKYLRDKIYEETSRSIELADYLFKECEDSFKDNGVDFNEIDINFEIHCDVGHKGKTNELIQEITGWVIACGYTPVTKPDSYAASAVADKFSK